MKRDVERFFKQLMVVLLMLRADCSLLALKPAHFSPYLPPSRPDYIEQLNGAGLRAEKATNDILLGIGAVQERLRIASDGRPSFYVYEYANAEPDRELDATHLPYSFEQEVDGYAWQKAKPGQDQKELPVPTQNHALDAVRYALMFLKKPKSGGGILLPTSDDVSEFGRQAPDEEISWWGHW